MPRPVSVADIAERIAGHAPPGAVTIIGVTGSVAAGKSTLCEALQQTLASTHQVEVISTDGFLLPNATLAARDLVLRKGFPESYDADGLLDVLSRARTGSVAVPVYSHTTYDIDPALTRTIDRPDILLVEGLALSPFPDGRSARDSLNLLLYLDAHEDDLETWFVARFMQLWRAAEADATSFYAQFRSMDEGAADTFARSVWARINLPNLRENIVRARDMADLVLRKDAAHALHLVDD